MRSGCRSGRIGLLIDVVLYAGERELLEIRTDLLKPDLTLVVEGNRTFTGTERKVLSLPNKFIHAKIEVEQNENPWDNEYALRRDGYKELEKLPIPDDAIVGFFDVDEIPDPSLIRTEKQVVAWNMAKYQMSLSWYQQEELTGLSGPWMQLKNKDVAKLRWSREKLPQIDAGYHLSSFMTLENTLAKWKGFSHQELVRPQMDKWVEHCWINGIAIENGRAMEQRQIENLPSQFLKLPKAFKRERPK